MLKKLVPFISYAICFGYAADIPQSYSINVSQWVWQKPGNYREEYWRSTPLEGYHFHTYFFQDNSYSKNQAIQFRNQIDELIRNGTLSGCRLNKVWHKPQGPHPVGNFETCCSSTNLSFSLHWFMQNHRNLSVLFHPLTRYTLDDHTTSAMWLGPVIPLDFTALPWDMNEALTCDLVELPDNVVVTQNSEL